MGLHSFCACIPQHSRRRRAHTLVFLPTCSLTVSAVPSSPVLQSAPVVVRPCAPAAWLRRFAALPWPAPALLAWAGAWALWHLALALQAPPALALALGSGFGVSLAWPCVGRLRRGLVALGFPLSALTLGAASALPAWSWLLLLLPLLAAYPLRAWQDAPFFPTPFDALDGLDQRLPAPKRVLDAGCGLGHGLLALRRVWPQAELHGIEWSAALAWLASKRCHLQGHPVAVRRADMWATTWSGFDMVYVFQRPESMARAFAKAALELAPGAHLVSLEFEVPGQRPVARLQGPGRKPVWVYRPAGAQAFRAKHSTQAVRCR
jgi:SAM-dependent methyltransferase